ncbi:CPBP family intramembrane glutamic endopeptidase [Acidobacteriota bacterium]
MGVESQELFTQATPKTTMGKILQFPLIRLILVLLFIGPYLLLHNSLIGDALASSSGGMRSLFLAVDVIFSIGIILFFYSLYTRFIEKRKALEFSGKQSIKELFTGILLSLGLVGGMVLLMTALGYYRVDQLNSLMVILDGVFFFGIGAFIQVLGFRLVLFKLSEEILGSWLAFVLVAVVFSLIHLGNPNAGFKSTVFFILGDILLAAAFIYTRRIWMVWGIHFGWNLFQDGVFGMPNSGITDFPSWIQPNINGPEWITGGSIGIEMSVIATVLSFFLGLLILIKAVEKKQIVAPVWKKTIRITSTKVKA